mgnify:CR=1 FL=1
MNSVLNMERKTFLSHIKAMALAKRINDNLVSKGHDISNAKKLFKKVKDKTTVTM